MSDQSTAEMMAFFGFARQQLALLAAQDAGRTYGEDLKSEPFLTLANHVRVEGQRVACTVEVAVENGNLEFTYMAAITPDPKDQERAVGDAFEAFDLYSDLSWADWAGLPSEFQPWREGQSVVLVIPLEGAAFNSLVYPQPLL